MSRDIERSRTIFLYKNDFIKEDFIELIYITSVSFDMNNRIIKIKYFDEFKNNIENAIKNRKENFANFMNFVSIRLNKLHQEISSK